MLRSTTHSPTSLRYQLRVRVVAEILDTDTGEIVASGDEEQIRGLYNTLSPRKDHSKQED